MALLVAAVVVANSGAAACEALAVPFVVATFSGFLAEVPGGGRAGCGGTLRFFVSGVAPRVRAACGGSGAAGGAFVLRAARLATMLVPCWRSSSSCLLISKPLVAGRSVMTRSTFVTVTVSEQTKRLGAVAPNAHGGLRLAAQPETKQHEPAPPSH